MVVIVFVLLFVFYCGRYMMNDTHMVRDVTVCLIFPATNRDDFSDFFVTGFNMLLIFPT